MAESILRSKFEAMHEDFEVVVHSAGTAGYHIGEQADHRTRAVLREKSLPEPSLARQARAADFIEYDYILAMDSSNYSDLLEIKPDSSSAQLYLMRYFDSESSESPVPDPLLWWL